MFDDDPDEDRSIQREIEEDDDEGAKDMKKLLKRHADDNEDYISSDDEEEDLPGAIKVKKEKKEKDHEEKKPSKRKTSGGEPPSKKVKIDVEAAIGMPEKEFEAQLRGAILVRGKMSTKDLIAKFKPVLKKSNEAKDVFTSIIKRIGITMKEEGVTYIGLKDDPQFRNVKR